MSTQESGDESVPQKKQSIKYRLSQLDQKKFALDEEDTNSDKTMQIVLPEEDEINQTMQIDAEDIQVHPDYLSEQTMQIGMDLPDENEAERTMYLTHLSQEEEADRTMMINFDNEHLPDLEATVRSPSESKTARYAKVLKPGESRKRDSSLPLSMSKADESRHQPMGDPRKRSSVSRSLTGSSSKMPPMKNDPALWAWTQTVHPTHGWLLALVLFPLSGLAFANLAFPRLLPDHLGPLPIVGSDSFLVQYVIPDVATSFLAWIMLAMLVQILFSAAGGRPPLVWTLKMMTYSLIPFAVFRLGWMGFHVLLYGPESFLRGYRGSWSLWLTPLLYTLMGGLTVFFLAKAAPSTHCQANKKRSRILFGMVPLLVLIGFLGLRQMQAWRFEQRIGPTWRRAETAWSNARPGEALPLLDEVLDYSRILTPTQKARFYQMRGELRLQEGMTLQAREDFVRTVQLLPPSHPENRLARAANLLALERFELARVQLQIAEEMRPASANVQRWLARLALGDFDPEFKNPALALDYARQAVALEPNAPNRALLERSEAALSAL